MQWCNDRVCKACSACGPIAVHGGPDESSVGKKGGALLKSLHMVPLQPCYATELMCVLHMQAVRAQKTVMLPVQLADDRTLMIESDSSLTSVEVCQRVATDIGLRDHFGFAVYISIYDKVRPPHQHLQLNITLFQTFSLMVLKRELISLH